MSAPAGRRILFVTHAPRDLNTAVYRYYATRSAWLSERGHSTEIWTPRDFERVAHTESRWWPLVYPMAVSRRIRRGPFRPELVFFHSYAGWSFAVRRDLGHQRSPRVLTQFHGLEPIYYASTRDEMTRAGRPFRWRYRLLAGWLVPALIRAATKRSDRVLCLNSQEMRYLVDRGWSAQGRTSVLPHAIDPSFFGSRDTRRTGSSLLFVGQWLEAKGVRYLVAAFERIARENPDARLRCAGVRCEAEAVRSMFGAAIRQRIAVDPELSQPEMAAAYREADLFVFPSLSEGFGVALLEAMAAGLPIVCTPVGAAPDLLRHEESAVFVPAGDVEALGTAVSKLLNEPARRDRLGAGARDVALAYRTEIWKPRFVEMVERLCEERTA